MLAALVPCHRDAPARELLEQVRPHVDTVLIVDDGCPRRARDELERLASDEGYGLHRLHANSGKGHAVAAGLTRLAGTSPAPDAVIVLDADGQHPPDRIPAFVAAAEDAELVVGDRFADPRAMPLRRRVANRLASALLSLLTRRHVRDSQCGMRLLRGRALAVPFPAGRYEAETMHLKRCLRAGVAVAWVPIPAIYDGETSSFRELRDTVRVLVALLRR